MNSSDIYSANLAIFQPPQIESAVLQEKFIQYTPTGSISSESQIEFSVPGTSAHYINLRKSRLNVRVKITKPDGSAVTNEDPVTLVNLSLTSLFRQVDVLLNQKNVSPDVGVNYPWKGFLDVLINYGHDVKETVLQGELYYKGKKKKNISLHRKSLLV